MLTYNTWFQAVFNTVAAASSATFNQATGSVFTYTDPTWLAELPNMIDYGEQRAYRDLDLLSTRVTDRSGSAVAGTRTFNLPTTTGVFVKLEKISAILPSSGVYVRSPILPYSPSYMDWAWPDTNSSAAWALPQAYAMRDNVSILLGPTPDMAYPLECVGTQRPQPLSAINQTTFLSTVLPDLFLTATLIRAGQFMRDDSVVAQHEAAYMELFRSADKEEASKMYRSQGWTSQDPRPTTTPPRQ